MQAIQNQPIHTHSFVLRGDVCYSASQTQLCAIPSGYVVCIDGISQGVFPTLPEHYQSLPLLDYSGKLVIPGLVDLHIHAPQYAFRGTGMDLELMDWLQQVAFPEEARYADMAYAKKAYTIFAEQLQKSATTRTCIFATRHPASTVLLMDIMEATGLISCVGKVNMDQNAPAALLDTSAESSASETLQWIQAAKQYRRTTPILTPRFLPACSDALLEKLQEIQQSCHLPVQSHLSENPDEIQWVQEHHPHLAFYGEGYHRFGLFGKTADGTSVPTIMAHGVYSSRQEAACMLENGVFLAHCPASNCNLSSGIAPIRRYLDMGIRVGLGSDVAGGHTTSIFRAVTDAIQVSKLYWRLVDSTASPLTFPEAFFMATKGGGSFFGKVGSLEAGFALDALVLDDSLLPHPQELTLCQRLERFAYLAGEQQGIVAKYVAGHPITI